MKSRTILALTLLLACFMSIKAYKIYIQKHLIPDASIVGYVSMKDGIGRQSAELIDVLKDTFDIHFRNTRDVNFEEVPPSIHHILKHRKRPFGKVVIFEDTLSIKDELFERLPLKDLKNHIMIAYSMFESSKIPQGFVDKLNRYFDLVCVPDPYHVNIYKESGVTRPIFVLPLGLSLDPFLTKPLKHTSHTPFVFGTSASCENRKNLPKLAQAFHKAFGDRSDVKLVIHSRRAQPAERKKLLDILETTNSKNISFLEKPLTKNSYMEFFESLDVFVSISKGEGYSISPREAMALGVPVVLSNNTAHKTICALPFVMGIDSDKEIPAFYDALDLTSGNFYDVDIDVVAKALQEAKNSYPKLLTNSHKLREFAKTSNFSELKKFYNTLINPSFVEFGQDNKITEIGIYTHSKPLIEKYKRILKFS